MFNWSMSTKKTSNEIRAIGVELVNVDTISLKVNSMELPDLHHHTKKWITMYNTSK
jgi:hypothetical protein